MERPGKRISELSGLDLRTLYSMFLNLTMLWPSAVNDLAVLLNKMSAQRIGAPLVVDEFALSGLPSNPEELVGRLASAVSAYLRQKLSETVTEARLLHISEEVVSEMLRDGIKTLLVIYGYW